MDRTRAHGDLESLQAALQHSEARYRALLASILDPLIAIDDHGTIRDASHSVERVFGYRPDELVGRNVKLLMGEPHHSKHDEYLANYRRTGVTHILNRTREFEVVRKDGSKFICELSVSRVESARGGPLFIGTFRDVTDRKWAESAMRDSERRFHAIFDGTYQHLGLLDLDGKILEVNRTALDATHVPRDELIGVPFWEGPWWSDAPTRERIRGGVAQAATGKFVRFEVEICGRHGRAIDLDFSLKPVKSEAGEVVLLIPEGRDISDIKRVQRAETTMLRALASIGESAALLAHEIKNPITAVNVALRAVADQLGEDHRAILEDLVTRMQRVQAIMQRTLSFAKPLELRPSVCDVRTLIDDTIGHVGAQIAQSEATVDRDIEPDLRLSCDVGLIEEVISNLIVNAIEARGQGAKLRIAAASGLSSDVELSIDDDGPGVSESLRASLFKPFVSTKRKGTGLGLAICKKIVEEHGGSIRVENSPLGGARFAIRLPRILKAGD
jgi:PAS domain S-box-containing protein